MRPTEAIRALRAEAATAGDTAQVEICDLALSGPPDEDHRIHVAYERCLQVIREAQSTGQEGS
jgi:hypothetical protein